MSQNRVESKAADLSGRTVLVTGGSGFLGRRLLPLLEAEGAQVVAPRSSEYDLRRPAQVTAVIADSSPQIVVHLAATVGGIGANAADPARFFYENAVMGLHLIEEARLAEVEKFVCLGTVCSYPKHARVPFSEDELWAGYPEETNAPYGIAKKMLLVQLDAYRAQYGFNGIYVLPCNLYGPGDNYDPRTSHVIPALVRKFVEATRQGRSEVVCWGTGRASREFLYVDDAARAIALATRLYNGPEPINIGSGQETTIRELAETIARLVGFRGNIVWDDSKPDGQPRRWLETSRAKRLLGFTAHVPFEAGLRTMIDDYLASHVAVSASER